MAKTFSSDAAATPSVGIPWSMPYPFSCSSRRDGTTTAGDTAAIKNLDQTKILKLWKVHNVNKRFVFYILHFLYLQNMIY